MIGCAGFVGRELVRSVGMGRCGSTGGFSKAVEHVVVFSGSGAAGTGVLGARFSEICVSKR